MRICVQIQQLLWNYYYYLVFLHQSLVPLVISGMVFDNILNLCVLNPADTVSVTQSDSFMLLLVCFCFFGICSPSIDARQRNLMTCRVCVGPNRNQNHVKEIFRETFFKSLLNSRTLDFKEDICARLHFCNWLIFSPQHFSFGVLNCVKTSVT